MDLGTMISEVQSYLGERSDITTAIAETQINRELLRLANAFDFHELETATTTIVSTPGVSSYILSTDMYTLVTVKDLTNNTTQLIPRDIAWYESQDASTNAHSVPEYVVRWNDSILLSPPPDGTYTYRLRSVERPPTLTASGDVPVIPEEWHEVLVLLAASRIAFRKSMDNKGLNLKNEALGIIDGMQEHRTGDRRQRTGQIQVQRTRSVHGS